MKKTGLPAGFAIGSPKNYPGGCEAAMRDERPIEIFGSLPPLNKMTNTYVYMIYENEINM
jgi:hypothetical protein